MSDDTDRLLWRCCIPYSYSAQR